MEHFLNLVITIENGIVEMFVYNSVLLTLFHGVSFYQARGASLQDDIIMHGHAELDPGWAPGDSIPRKQPCGPRCVLSRSNGDHGSEPCFLLG